MIRSQLINTRAYENTRHCPCPSRALAHQILSCHTQQTRAMNPYIHHSDADLVTRLLEADHNAFEAIYRRYAAPLYKYARRNISIKEDCEEIIQDIFENLWARHDNLRHVTNLKGYLYQMVKHKIIRYFAHSAVKKRYAAHYKLFEAVVASNDEIERDPEAIQAIIKKGLENLPDRCRLAVWLRLTENLSNSDIARRMNIKKSTVENYMVRAFNHLRTTCADLYKTI